MQFGRGRGQQFWSILDGLKVRAGSWDIGVSGVCQGAALAHNCHGMIKHAVCVDLITSM